MASSVIFSEEDFMENAKPPKDKTTSVEASGRKYTTPAPRIEVKATAASQARAALHPSLKTLSGKKEASSDSTTSAPSLKPTLPESKASTIKKPTTNPNGIGWSEMMKSFKASGETHIKPDKVSAFNDSKMTELCGVLEGKNIVSLDFSGKKFTTGAAKILANFLKLQPTITQLILANTVISLSELSILSQGFDYLEELDLSIAHSGLNTLSTDAVSILGAFETISNAGGLTKINFGEVKETHLPELTGLLQKNTSLQDIKLSAAKMSNIAFKKLIEAVSNKKLNSLKLSVESISFKLASEKSDGVAIEELLMPLIASKITYLDLTGAKFFTDRASLALAHTQRQLADSLTLKGHPFIEFVKKVYTASEETLAQTSTQLMGSFCIKGFECLVKEFFGVKTLYTQIHFLRSCNNLTDNLAAPLLDIIDRVVSPYRFAKPDDTKIEPDLQKKAEVIADILTNNPYVTKVIITNAKMLYLPNHHIATLLKALEKSTSITIVKLGYLDINPDMAYSLVQIISNNNLTDVQFDNVRFLPGTSEAIAQSIEKNHAIMNLAITNPSNIEAHEESFVNYLGENTTLTRLQLTSLSMGSNLFNLKKISNLKYLTVQNIDSNEIQFLMDWLEEDTSIHLEHFKVTSPASQIALMKAAIGRKSIAHKLDIPINELSMKEISSFIITSGNQPKAQEMQECIELLNVLGFTKWNEQLHGYQGTLVGYYISLCIDEANVKQILSILPKGKAMAVGLNDKAISWLLQKNFTAYELLNILKILDKFENINVFNIAATIMKKNLNIREILESHKSLQNLETLSKLAHEAVTLIQLRDLIAYRKKNFGEKSVPNLEWEVSLVEVSKVTEQIGKHGWSIADCLGMLKELGFTNWNTVLTNGHSFIDTILNRHDITIFQVEELLKKAQAIDGMVINESSICIIMNKDIFTKQNVCNIVQIFNNAPNWDMALLVKAVQSSCNNVLSSQFITWIAPAKAATVLPIFLQTTKSFYELIALVTNIKEKFNTKIGDLDKALFAHLDFNVTAENYKDFAQIAADLLKGKRLPYLKTYLQILDFNLWDSVVTYGKTFLQIVLEKFENLSHIEILLKACAELRIPIRIDHKSIDLIFTKPATVDTNMQAIVKIFNGFENIDLVKVASKVLLKRIPNITWDGKIRVNHWGQIISLANQHHITPNDFIKCLEGAPSPVVLSKCVEKIESLQDFETLMTTCHTKFGMGFAVVVGDNANHIITYLPSLVKLGQISEIAQRLGSPIDWTYTNREGDTLAAKMVLKIDSYNLQEEILFLLDAETGIDWNGSLQGKKEVLEEGEEPTRAKTNEDSLLLIVASSAHAMRHGQDYHDIWEMIFLLLSRLKGNLPEFSVNYRNYHGTKLIDIAKDMLESCEANRESMGIYIAYMQENIAKLRNHGSVEPKEHILKEYLLVDKEHIESGQNYQALPKLSAKLHNKYKLTEAQIKQQIADMKAAVLTYVTETYPVIIDRDVVKELILKEINYLLVLRPQHKDNNNFDWTFEDEIAHLWACAKDSGTQKEFLALFPGLNECTWGRLVNLYVAENKAIMGQDVEKIEYESKVADFAELVQKKTIEKLRQKLPLEDLPKTIAEAFTDFLKTRTHETGEPMAQNWKMSTQLVIGALNEVFAKSISSILGKEINGLIESYHYDQFMQHFVTGIITQHESCKGELTDFFFSIVNNIADQCLKALLANPNDANKIIIQYNTDHGTLFDLSNISSETMTQFLGMSLANKKSVFKALKVNKVKVSNDLDDCITSTLAEVKNTELKEAINSFIEQNNDVILKQFGNDWVLDQATFANLNTAILSTIPLKKKYLTLQKLSTATYLRKDYPATTACQKEFKDTKKHLVEEIFGDSTNVDKQIIDDFIKECGDLDLNCLDTAQLVDLLKADDIELVEKLLTDEKIILDLSKLIEAGDNTLLLFKLADIAMKSPYQSKAKVEALQKVNTENLANNIKLNPLNSEALIDDFILKVGSLDLNLLDTHDIRFLFVQASESLINKILTCSSVIIDWSRLTGEDNHTLLHQLAHMFEGKFEQKAMDIYLKHKDNEDWSSMKHDLLSNGHVDELFGDLPG